MSLQSIKINISHNHKSLEEFKQEARNRINNGTFNKSDIDLDVKMIDKFNAYVTWGFKEVVS